MCTVYTSSGSPLHGVPDPARLLADGYIEGVNVGHLGSNDGREV